MSQNESPAGVKHDTAFIMALGCAKNQVDSEVMAASLLDAGFTFVGDPEEADVIVLTTCSFLREAAEESLDFLDSLIPYRLEGRCRCLVLAGCLVQRYGQPLCEKLPQVDLFLGMHLASRSGPIVARFLEGRWDTVFALRPSPDFGPLESTPPEHRQALAPWAYVKVSEGCSNHCTYCTLPAIRGPLESRPPAEIVSEVTHLVQNGVQEINLVAQDVAAYGLDRRQGSGDWNLASLLPALQDIAGLRWIRLLYCHPAHVDGRLISRIGELDKICPYLDLPVQHASSNVLKAMNRPYDARTLKGLIGDLRQARPDVALRTTCMVGFPGETEDDFRRLVDFLEETRFHHVGVFTYSHEEGAPSQNLADTVPDEEKQQRAETLMALQARISTEIMEGYRGSLQEVLLEGPDEENPHLVRGRTWYQAPEVDGCVFIPGTPDIVPGLATVRITGSQTYDLEGELLTSDPV